MISPVYSSLGRIREVLICKDDQFKSVQTAGERVSIYSQVQMSINELLNLINEKSIKPYIFFDCEPEEYPIEDPPQNGFSYHVAPDGSGIMHKWAQDWFHFSHNKETGEIYLNYFRLGMNTNIEIDRWIVKEIEGIAMQNNYIIKNDFINIFPGGNALMGHHNNEDYLLVGNSKYCTINKKQLAYIFNISESNIFLVPEIGQIGFMLDFFHLDLYLTVVGKTGTKGIENACEVLLLAEAYGIKDGYCEPLQMVNDYLVSACPFFKIIRLPCIILKVNNKNRVYSYNNCLVENYFDGDNENIRKLNFYLPDYSSKFLEHFHTLKNNLALTIEFRHSLLSALRSFEEKKFYSGFINSDVYKYSLPPIKEFKKSIRSKTRNKQELFIKEAEDELNHLARNLQPKISEMLKSIGASEVYFFDCNYIDEAAIRGSLHCLTKVLKRDKVTLE